MKALSSLLGKLAAKSRSRSPRNHWIYCCLVTEPCKRSGWLAISKFVGTHNRCWSFDIHIFHDQDEEKIHHAVKTAVIPNIKAAFSSS